MKHELRTLGLALLFLPTACASESTGEARSPATVTPARAAEPEPQSGSEVAATGTPKADMKDETVNPTMSKSTTDASSSETDPSAGGTAGGGGTAGMGGRGGRGGRGGSGGR